MIRNVRVVDERVAGSLRMFLDAELKLAAIAVHVDLHVILSSREKGIDGVHIKKFELQDEVLAVGFINDPSSVDFSVMSHFLGIELRNTDAPAR